MRCIKPEIILIAEDHANWPGVVQPPDAGGLGFDATWYADFYHHLIGDTDKGIDYAKLLKSTALGPGPLAMDYFAGALQATSGASKVTYHESHDEAGNGGLTDRTICVAVNGAALIDETRRVAEDRVRFVATIGLVSAGVPMFLFGEEVGAQRKFLYNRVLENREDYVGLRQGVGSHLFAFYKDIVELRLGTSGIKLPDLQVVYVNNENRILAFLRGRASSIYLVIGSLNDAPFASPNYEFRSVALPDAHWTEIFNSDAQCYGGTNIGNAGGTLVSARGSFACVLPARGVVIFELSAM